MCKLVVEGHFESGRDVSLGCMPLHLLQVVLTADITIQEERQRFGKAITRVSQNRLNARFRKAKLVHDIVRPELFVEDITHGVLCCKPCFNLTNVALAPCGR